MGEHQARTSEVVCGDGLRAFAAMGVLAYHVAIGAALADGVAGDALFTDAFGVAGHVLAWFNVPLYVFFVLSGYLVGRPFVLAWIEGGEAPETAGYLRRRAARIVPAFWIVCAYLLVRQGTSGDTPQSVAALFGLFPSQVPGALADGFPQAWTLHVEATFYVLLAVAGLVVLGGPLAQRAAAMTPRARRSLLTALLGVLGVATLVVRERTGFEGPVAESLVAVGFAFVPGLLLAAHEPRLRALRPVPARRAATTLAALALAAVAVLVVLAPGGEGARGIGYLLASGGLVGAVLLHEWHRGAPRWARRRTVRALGRWSYGVYLWHVVVAVELGAMLPDGLSATEAFAVLLPTTVVVSVALGAASWRFVEAPALRWARGGAGGGRPVPLALRPEAAASEGR